MSGTSLDGLDIVACTFQNTEPINFNIVHAETKKYSGEWLQKLDEADKLSSEELTALDFEYGKWLGNQVVDFCARNGITPGLIASHGHTVFHRPELGYTLQIGNIGALSLAAGCSAVADFRAADVAIGGQGAPLVPIGDELLFGRYSACVNLGGFANISYRCKEKRIAYDICPLNMPLNEWAMIKGFHYDEDGSFARSGKLIPELQDELLALEYFIADPPKSLGREWYRESFRPLLNDKNFEVDDVLRTLVEVQSTLIESSIPKGTERILLSGGGTYNKFLIQLLEKKRPGIWVVPEVEIIDFKEALIFAFLGWLRVKGRVNCLSSVTGAPYDHSSGVIYPYKNMDN
jgi:anhydro-N-acetylmuramic acid kinase